MFKKPSSQCGLLVRWGIIARKEDLIGESVYESYQNQSHVTSTLVFQSFGLRWICDLFHWILNIIKAPFSWSFTYSQPTFKMYLFIYLSINYLLKAVIYIQSLLVILQLHLHFPILPQWTMIFRDLHLKPPMSPAIKSYPCQCTRQVQCILTPVKVGLF